VTRLELAAVRICERCGRGRAELAGGDGATLTVPLDAARAHELAGGATGDGVAWLSELLLAQLRAGGAAVRDVVLDARERGLAGLVTIARGDDLDVVACTAQEAIGLAVRARVTLYATDEALAAATTRAAAAGHQRLH
jgi:hypothetical protein